ncbi:MAG: RluA family pseudouridine synthase, partial [bacterium]|nr:RluA family pseudouridine synthase [bacterium]
MVDVLRTHAFLPEESGIRLDSALVKAFSDMSRSYIQSLISEERVRINDHHKKSNYVVKSGDKVSMLIPEAKSPEASPQDIALHVFYQDADVAVVNKPSGMVVHPAHGNYSETLVNALLFHINDLSGVGGVLRPGIVHRLDKDTSGLLVVAKNDKSHHALSAQLSSRSMTREYLAIVHGKFKEKVGTINAPIGRNPRQRKEMAVVSGGRLAVTHYRVIEEFKDYSY